MTEKRLPDIPQNAGAPVGSYSPDGLSKSPSWRMGKAAKCVNPTLERAKRDVPGPGNYNMASTEAFSKKWRFHMGQKLTFNPTEKYLQSVPGPGDQSPSTKMSKSKAPAFSMRHI